jgi:RNA polymerase sigma-70 factor (ECF subfamily)
MTEPITPSTRLTLIGALAKGLRWEEFVALYGRIILSWARANFGLQECDAENLCQEVLIRVWKGIGGYDHRKGRFRNWLYACTRNAVLNLWRGQAGQPVCLPFEEMDDRDRSRPGRVLRLDSCDGDLERAIRRLEENGYSADGLHGAVRNVRSRVHPNTWKAFLLFEFFEMKAKEIAPLVELPPASVNQAVHRVRRLLRQAFSHSSPPTGDRRPVSR